MTLNADTVRELLDYDPETGALTWKTRGRHWFAREHDCKAWSTKFAGKPAGSRKTNPDGYSFLRVKVLGRGYPAGRLVWLYMTGDWPKGQVDHIDRDPLNQKWSNLRDVSAAQNSRNRSVQVRVWGRGYPGVWFRRQKGAWYSQIQYNGNQIGLGYHKTLLDAVAAKKRAEREYGFSSGHGQPRPERSISHGR